MPAVKCPFDGCDYVTDDLEATIVVALIKAHTTAHTVGKVVTTKTPAEPKTSTDPVTPPTPTDNVHRSVGDLNIPLQICHKYNSNGCDRGNACPFLHLCKSYIESRCESGKECSKSHNFQQPQVKAIMEKHGIDVKRKTKEILQDLQAAVKEFKGQSKDDSKTKQKDRAASPKKGSIQICNKYNGDCCEKGDTCQFLHLCKSYIESRCESGKECNKSHNILEPQVKAIMTKHGIDVNRKFKEILRDLQTAVKESKGQNNDDSKTKPKAKVSSEKTPKKSFVGICYKYNGGGCEIANSCPFLHLCKNYIEGRCESGKECKKSHNILEPQVKVIMEKHGIDVKRKPKEIFPDLLASVNEGKRQRERENSKAQDCVNKPPKPTICFKYNNSGCENSESCPRIHMCRDYIYSKCEAGKGCAKSHNILQLAVKSKLEQHGMNTKQKPGDLLAELRAALRSETDEVKTDDRKQVNDADGNKKSAPKICYNYNGRGCEKAGSCSYIHMCKSYIDGKCEAGRGCNKSHDILEPAVKANLEKHGINTKRKPKDILADFQAALNGENRKGNITAGCGAKDADGKKKSAPKICYNYNGRGCETAGSCSYIHMCKSYIDGKCEAGRGCNKSHDILEPEVKANLEKYGINTKRKPKDILADFQAALNRENRKGNITAGCEAKVATHSRKPAKVSRKKVCIFNLRGICKWNFCPNVHCDLPYQWRWKLLSAKEWTPLYQHENVETERAFCDPANEVYRLVTEQGVNINIDFKTMIGTDFEGQIFVVNRLSTPSSVELERQLWATNWMWYWKNENGGWMNYSDTVGEIEKGDIEQAFINNPDGQFPLREIGSIIDFSKMMQVNDNPAPEVEICRRPVFVSEKEAEERKTRQTQRKRGGQIPNQPKLERVSSTTELSAPPNWNMLPEEDLSDHRQLVPLKENDTEYKEIKGLFLESLGRPRTVRIKSIERIENGDLWEDFVGKQIKMLKKKTEEEVGERRLFHGTRNQYIDPIWNRGFDFRLSGQTSGTVYGKGSYFATTSRYSNCYAELTAERAMFVVKILPGAYVRGSSEYKRPPHKDEDNPCSELYDSCVDNETNPQIFIIFDNNQIYPEYLIRYEC
ncbi:protein mono-ADP-ribosyltransferase PARP12-like isoform X4 [Ruditapes philippinarum]|uniref:protein mono-ADP-ribosyltransferase PARP12-like isoform X4 n=1 Tax=Ruditapes philippinarum TaxID=129788 RepID=UPI00295BC2BE|nr:protein mono-ADP-ribosyltransferase PARP12-like isoform X4 [Ruditapes philippinarum]